MRGLVIHRGFDFAHWEAELRPALKLPRIAHNGLPLLLTSASVCKNEISLVTTSRADTVSRVRFSVFLAQDELAVSRLRRTCPSCALVHIVRPSWAGRWLAAAARDLVPVRLRVDGGMCGCERVCVCACLRARAGR